MAQTNAYGPYVDGLLKRANLDALPPHELEEHKEKLTEEVEKRVGIMIMSELGKEQLDAYTSLMAANADDKTAHEFLQTNIPDFNTKLQEALIDFGKQYLGVTSALN